MIHREKKKPERVKRYKHKIQQKIQQKVAIVLANTINSNYLIKIGERDSGSVDSAHRKYHNRPAYDAETLITRIIEKKKAGEVPDG